MKKKIILSLAVVLALALGVVGMSAFEAHVINVTAQIENALTVPVEASGLSFGTVFPEEVAFQNLDIQLSSSFLTTDRVDDIEYVIRQKPKCGVPVVPATIPATYSSHPQVTENAEGIFACPDGSVMLPLLCPYLSKHEVNGTGGIDAFHGPLTGWTMTNTLATEVGGRLSKADGKTSTSWIIDLHAPCFQGLCAQDNVIPIPYQADPAYEGQLFGCDLWVEVKGISPSGNGNLTVTKIVNGGDKIIANFPLFVDGMTVTSGVATSTFAGSHTVTETADPDYTESFSANCLGGIVNVPVNGSVTCTITNTYNVALTGSLTVHKIVVGSDASANSFPLFVDGMSVTNDSATATSAGSHIVTETPNSDYTTTFGNGCDTNGNVTVPSDGTIQCDVTNTLIGGNLIVIKEVVGSQDLPSAFTINVSGGTPLSFAGSSGTSVNVPGNGAYNVTENTVPSGYTVSYSADCSSTMPPTGTKTCTVTNTRDTGAITVIKVVNNHIDGTTTGSDNFQMTIDGSDVAQNTPLTYSTGSHTVGEVSNSNYTVSFSAGCPGGVVNVTKGNSTTCTVTNEEKFFTVTVTKVVNNDPWNGNNVIADFPLFVGAHSVTNNVSKNFAPGTYLVSESSISGYFGIYAGDCSSGTHLISGINGDSKTCTLTNNALPAQITLIKAVDIGSALPTDFLMRVDGTPVSTGGSTLVTANTAHSITEDAKTGYSPVLPITITGSAKCPSVLSGTATLDEGEAITCTIHNTAD